MEKIIITEGAFDCKLLTMVLPMDLLINTRIRNAGGYSSALSLARTFLEEDFEKEKFVFLVVDADTTDQLKIKEKQAFINNYIGNFENFSLTVFEPQIEVLLFESKALIEKVSNRSISNYDVSLGKYNPSEAFKHLEIQLNPDILKELNEDDKSLMRNNHQLISLMQALKEKPKVISVT